jgi:hypothetical protein
MIMFTESYKSREFVVANADARLRKAGALATFETDASGKIRTIPIGMSVKVKSISVQPSGGKLVSIFAETVNATDGAAIGWTSVGNFVGGFFSETIGEISPPPGANRFGPNAAWENGQFLGQITLVKVVGTGYEIKYIAKSTVEAFLALAAAARSDGRMVRVNSGFRSFPEQSQLFDGFKRGLPGFNPANRPGNSNHQNGIAFDLDTRPGDGNPDYEWLTKNATRFGFLRTVSREFWHWEFQPTKAAKARAKGVFGTFM